MGGIWEEFLDVWRSDWEPIGLPAAITLLSLFALIAGLEAASAESWVPLLDSVNLVFHEAGHPLFGLFGWQTLTILGGTFMQLLVPLLVAGSFGWKRQAGGFAFGCFWFFQNFHHIGRYMADARAGLLPLAGGGEHDWEALFGAWGLLDRDLSIGHGVAVLGWLGMTGVAVWLGLRAWRVRPGRYPASRS